MAHGQIRIERVYAFVTVDPADDTEGIPAFRGPDGMLMPMIAADKERFESLRPTAERYARESGLTLEVVVFTTRMHVDTITP